MWWDQPFKNDFLEKWEYEGSKLPPICSTKQQRPLCRAYCRSTGKPCQARVVINPKTKRPINGHCRMHGGLSTGAKTEEGRKKCAAAARRGMLNYWSKKNRADQL